MVVPAYFEGERNDKIDLLFSLRAHLHHTIDKA